MILSPCRLAAEAEPDVMRSHVGPYRAAVPYGASEQGFYASCFTLDGPDALMPHTPPCAALRLLRSSFAPPACSPSVPSWAPRRAPRSWASTSSRTATKIPAQECSGRRASIAMSWSFQRALGSTRRGTSSSQESLKVRLISGGPPLISSHMAFFSHQAEAGWQPCLQSMAVGDYLRWSHWIAPFGAAGR